MVIKYYIYKILGIFIFGFKCDDFSKLFEYSGKELFATQFKGNIDN